MNGGTRPARSSHSSLPKFHRRDAGRELGQALGQGIHRVLRSGIDFRSYAPSYFFTKLEDLKLDLLEEAAANSKLRAERLAKSAGNRVVGVISA